MYYPMRVVRDKRYKLIWNIAHPLPYPFASDLWAASSFQAQYRKSLDAPYGQKTVGEYIHRPAFELYRIDEDPHESKNLAAAPPTTTSSHNTRTSSAPSKKKWAIRGSRSGNMSEGALRPFVVRCPLSVVRCPLSVVRCPWSLGPWSDH